MEEYTINDEMIERVTNQFRLWALFLNNGIGILSFTLALACLGTPIPWASGILSLAVVACVRSQGKKFFPPDITELRIKAKECEKADLLLKGLENKFFNIKALLKDYPIFLIGFMFLGIVAISPLLFGKIDLFSKYFNI